LKPLVPQLLLLLAASTHQVQPGVSNIAALALKRGEKAEGEGKSEERKKVPLVRE
jgi:hypothetical protein